MVSYVLSLLQSAVYGAFLSAEHPKNVWGFPVGAVVKKLPAEAGRARDTGLIPGLGRVPEVGNGRQPTPVFLPGKFHGQRSRAGYNPWGHESQTQLSDWVCARTHAHTHTHTHTHTECLLNFLFPTSLTNIRLRTLNPIYEPLCPHLWKARSSQKIYP